MFFSKNHGENEAGLKSLKSSILGKSKWSASQFQYSHF